MEKIELEKILEDQFDFVYGLDSSQNKIVIKKEKLRDVVYKLKQNGFDMLKLISSVDYDKSFNVLYHFLSTKKTSQLVVEVQLNKEQNEISITSLTSIYKSANWLEREVYDLMGIKFEGHPELERILLPLDWEGYPLRKDYVIPNEYHGISK